MAFGPDSDLNLDFDLTFRIPVPPRGRVRFDFLFDAVCENAIIVYDTDNLSAKLIERGNGSRSRDPFEFNNPTDHPKELVISAWHKLFTPENGGGHPWFQSQGREFSVGGNVRQFGFDDGGGPEVAAIPPTPDFDFNDAVTFVLFV